jgi:hypothetical protein
VGAVVELGAAELEAADDSWDDEVEDALDDALSVAAAELDATELDACACVVVCSGGACDDDVG